MAIIIPNLTYLYFFIEIRHFDSLSWCGVMIQRDGSSPNFVMSWDKFELARTVKAAEFQSSIGLAVGMLAQSFPADLSRFPHTVPLCN